MKSLAINSIAVAFIFALLVAFSPQVSAYAPNISGEVIQNTGAPLVDIYVKWDSYEEGNDSNPENKGHSFRYSRTGSDGDFFFKSWDSEGIYEKDGIRYSTYGDKEYAEKINLDYDDSNGNETRRSTTNQYNIFNCNNEVNSFSVVLPPSLKGAKVEARWRRDSNNTAWSSWTANTVTLPKEMFTNSHDYELQFRIQLPKKASVRDLEKNIDNKTISNLNTKIPACVKVTLCNEDEASCSQAYKPAAGKHRVVLSQIGNSGIGEAQRKLSITDETRPLWLVECVQKGTAEQPNFICTTGNSQLDRKVFGQDNLAVLNRDYGYRSQIYFDDGTTATTAEITRENRRDAYEWETQLDPDKVQAGKVSSVFLAMYDPTNTAPLQSGNQPSQIQATLSNSEGCKLVVDPYGRTFDSYTLEPLASVDVMLTKKRASGNYTPVQGNEVVGTLLNPQRTPVSGSFSFIVPSGTYRLEATKSGYRFPAQTLNTNASRVYPNIYDGRDIVVKEQPVQVNIPLDPENIPSAISFAKTNPIKIQSYFQIMDTATGNYQIEGTVTHPAATINLYTKTPVKRLVGSGEANSLGHFTIKIPLTSLKEGEVITELEARKKEIPSVVLEENEKSYLIQLDPLTRDIDQFAVNNAGSLMPNSTVELVMNGSSVPAYVTTTDETGHFYIPNAFIPPLPYTLTFHNDEVAETVTPRTLLARNERLSSINNYYASTGSNVMGEFDRSDDPIDENAYQSLDGQPSRSLQIIAALLVGAVFAGTVLLSSYITHETRQSRRRR